MKLFRILYIILSVALFSACTSDLSDSELVVCPSESTHRLAFAVDAPAQLTRVDEMHPGKSSWSVGDGIYTLLRYYDENGREMSAFSQVIKQTLTQVTWDTIRFVMNTDFNDAVPLNAVKAVSRSFYSNDTTYTFSFADTIVTFVDSLAGYNDMLVSTDTLNLGKYNDTLRISAWKHPLSRIKVVSLDSTYVMIKSISVPRTYDLKNNTISFSDYRVLKRHCSTADNGFYKYENMKTYTCAFFFGRWLKDEYILTYANSTSPDDLPTFVGKPAENSQPGISYLIDLRDKVK